LEGGVGVWLGAMGRVGQGSEPFLPLVTQMPLIATALATLGLQQFFLKLSFNNKFRDA